MHVINVYNFCRVMKGDWGFTRICFSCFSCLHIILFSPFRVKARVLHGPSLKFCSPTMHILTCYSIMTWLFTEQHKTRTKVMLQCPLLVQCFMFTIPPHELVKNVANLYTTNFNDYLKQTVLCVLLTSKTQSMSSLTECVTYPQLRGSQAVCSPPCWWGSVPMRA